MKPILTVAIKTEQDIVAARQRARQIGSLLGFGAQDGTRIATAVSEIARNAFQYAAGGKVEFGLEGVTAPQLLIVRIIDNGPGIAHLDEVLAGSYRSESGMGLGLVGARRLMDQMDVRPAPVRGTIVTLKKMLPRGAPLVTAVQLGRLASPLAAEGPHTPLEEVQQQNRELLAMLAELRERQEDLIRLNQELEDTNRGVVALYAELDEKADHLRRADEMKSRFLSNMSHEFRTPLNSIRALSNLLLEGSDGDLTGEQEKQVRFIRKSAEDLAELVNDLLDLAKIEAGKIDVKPVEFDVTTLFSALRGMLRPLLVGERVSLIFDEPTDVPLLYTDEGKVSQILRNFLSNALKFTERGEVRVSATASGDGEWVTFDVADTGIGIAPEDLESIFDEFTQIDNPLQRRYKGTGLGLPLCRRLAALLGGTIEVESTPGVGSRFSARLPVHHRSSPANAESPAARVEIDPARIPVLLVEDEAETRLLYEKYLRGSCYQLLPARSLREAREQLLRQQPAVIVLDILLRGEASWNWLAEIKGDPNTRAIPVLVVTTVEDERKTLALGANAYCLKPVDRTTLLSQLDRLRTAAVPIPVLIIEDDEPARYVAKKLLASWNCAVHEAADGISGLSQARALHPHLVLLDLGLPGLPGEQVLKYLRDDPSTADIPVAVVTAQKLDAIDRARLGGLARAVLCKDELNADRIRDLIRGIREEAET